MANVVVDDLTLKEIADAIRMKNGLDNTYMPSEMPAAIRRLCGGNIDPKYLALTGDLTEYNKNGIKSWMFNEYLDQITYSNITSMESMHLDAKNLKKAHYPKNGGTVAMFKGCENLESLVEKDISNPKFMPTECFSGCKSLKHFDFDCAGSLLIYKDYPDFTSMFEGCNSLESVNGNWTFSLPSTSIYNGSKLNNIFKNCYKLKEINPSIISRMVIGENLDHAEVRRNKRAEYYSAFQGCLSLRKIDLVYSYNSGSGMQGGGNLTNIVDRCAMLDHFVINNQHISNSSPIRVDTMFINLDTCGYASTPEDAAILEGLYGPPVTTDEEYAAHKNDPDWWTNDPKYSRYNKKSFIETLTYLPKLGKVQHGGGTFQCRGDIVIDNGTGSNTDGGGINSSDSEIMQAIALTNSSGYTIHFH